LGTERLSFERRLDAEHRSMNDDEIVDFMMQVAEVLFPVDESYTGITPFYHTDFESLIEPLYVGQTVNFIDRSESHSSGREELRSRKSFNFLGRTVFQQHIISNIHPDQINLFEELLMLMTGSSYQPLGLNSRSPSQQTKEFYRVHLKDKIREFKQRVPLLRKESSCSSSSSLSKSNETDPDDDDGGLFLKRRRTKPFLRALLF
jgi:hypothetical protein